MDVAGEQKGHIDGDNADAGNNDEDASDGEDDERLVDSHDCGDIQPPVPPPPATQMSTETPSKCDDPSDRLDNGNGCERTPEPLRHHGGLHRYH